jgi:hypothetical protein
MSVPSTIQCPTLVVLFGRDLVAWVPIHPVSDPSGLNERVTPSAAISTDPVESPVHIRRKPSPFVVGSITVLIVL